MEKIVSARIEAPKHWGDEAKVFVITEGSDEEEQLFSYFDDELSFRENEFIGLTKDQALNLFQQRDQEYLHS